MKLRFLAAALIMITSAALAPVHGQAAELDHLADSLDALISGALRVNIQARIVEPGQGGEVWTMDLTRVTIGGRSVRVRLEGANIIVIADFTPYWESEDELLLVAQGQTWVTDDTAGGETIHRTSFTTMPIRLGEPLVFLPLGTDLDNDQLGLLNIELEINVERYQS